MIPGLVERNRRFAETFDAGHLPAPPAERLAVLTCMDARIDPLRALGLALGDAHVIRNAGGRASGDALRSLIVSTHLLGTRAVAVIHHTDCGMQTFTDEALQARLAAELGADASDLRFLTFSDLEESVREDVLRIRSSPFLPRDLVVEGYVYDVRSGTLREIEVPTGEPGIRPGR